MRRKADKSTACSTTDEAISLLGRYAALQASITARRADADAKIAQIRAAVDGALAADEAQLKAWFNALKPWWAVSAEALTEGKRKSIELGGCLIGHRLSTPRVVHPNLTEAEAVEQLRDHDYDELVRVVRELDKPAILRMLADDDVQAAEIRSLGFASKQTETFFIDRIKPAEPAVQIVTDAAPADVQP